MYTTVGEMSPASRSGTFLSGGFNEATVVWSSHGGDVLCLESNHEEADTRIVLHARDATLRQYQQVIVICRDTDVNLILLAHQCHLCETIWMFSGFSDAPYRLRTRGTIITPTRWTVAKHFAPASAFMCSGVY